MYPLGKQFAIDNSKSRAEEKAIFRGPNYRISIITERVVRLEYNPTGKFVDEPTQLIRTRNLGFPNFRVNQDQNFIEITTKYFKLLYIKRQPFVGPKTAPNKNLKITLMSRDPARQREWYFMHPEARNMNGNMVSIDVPCDKSLQHGLYSLEGFASINDTPNKLLNVDGTPKDRESNTIDVYVFMYDNDFKQALQDYYRMTGYPELIPRYALGNWWSRNTDYNEESLKEVIRRFEKKKIPLSILLLDNDWHYRNVGSYKNLKTGFTFNKSLFPNPKNTIDEIHKKGIRFGLVIDPEEGIFPHEAMYQTAAGYLEVTDNKIIEFDPLNPRVLDVYFKVMLHPLEQLGVDFFWSDYKGHSNLTNLWFYNHYLYLDSGRVAEKRSMMLARGSIFAPHRYPILYGGSSNISWEDLAKLPGYYLNAANMGVSFWSHDVGGNHGGIEEDELYIRYLQLSVFSPILRFHGARGPYYKKEPWLWDFETQNIAADYLRLRHRLIPYLYTEAYNYTKAGTPLVQPFYYNYMWTYDDDLYKNQYYFGSQLLVCPILTKMDKIMNRTIHRFFIPEGIWYDFTTGKKFPGNKKYISFYKEEDYPVFAHAGSIIPLSNRSDYNNTGIPTDLEIQIFPGVSNTYNLYDDDGVTSLYKDGYYLKTSIDYNYLKNNYTVIIRSIEGKSGIVPAKRNYKVVFRNTKEAESVTAYYNGVPCSFKKEFDGNDFVVEVNGVPTIGQLTINCRGKDIEIDAVRVINDDVKSILMDLKINTYLKEDIASIMFSDLNISKKRIEVRKLRRKGLSRAHVNLFLKLLEYISEF